MTQTQIDYLSHLEDKRHNQETERQGQSNVESNRIQAEAAKQNADTNRKETGATYMSAAGSLARGVGGLLPAIGSLYLLKANKAATLAKTAKDVADAALTKVKAKAAEAAAAKAASKSKPKGKKFSSSITPVINLGGQFEAAKQAMGAPNQGALPNPILTDRQGGNENEK